MSETSQYNLEKPAAELVAYLSGARALRAAAGRRAQRSRRRAGGCSEARR